jgi:hypothetical protein
MYHFLTEAGVKVKFTLKFLVKCPDKVAISGIITYLPQKTGSGIRRLRLGRQRGLRIASVPKNSKFKVQGSKLGVGP